MPRRGDGRSTDEVRRTPVRLEQEACESRSGNGRRLTVAGAVAAGGRRSTVRREGGRRELWPWAGPGILKEEKKTG